MLSWEYPPVVIGGLGRHVHHLATALATAGTEVMVLSRRPFDTDPSTHPTTDEVHDGVRVVAAAQDPHEFAFDTDIMAWTLAMGHSMLRAALAAGLTRMWFTLTTGWFRTLRSLSPSSSMCLWFPRCTRRRPDGIPDGSTVG